MTFMHFEILNKKISGPALLGALGLWWSLVLCFYQGKNMDIVYSELQYFLIFGTNIPHFFPMRYQYIP